jgi:hypothetical protein
MQSRRTVLKALTIVGGLASAPVTRAAQAGPMSWRQAEALAEVKALIRSHYIFPERREPLVAAIEAAQGDRLGTASTPTEFADAITDVMQSAVSDRHLALVHDPDWALTAGAPADSAQAAFDAEAIRDHYGIVRQEWLPGNLRAVRISGFGWVNDQTGEAYDGLMRFLGDADAILFDIRGNSGGDHSAVRYLISHFLEPSTKLYDFVSTREPSWSSFALDNLPAGRIRDKLIYVLIDGRTVSAGEDLAYQVQQYGLGQLVGTRTAGAANNNEYFAIEGLYRLSLSIGRPIHPVSGDNWEGRGIEPDQACPSHEAFDRAVISACERLSTRPGITPLAQAEYDWTRQNAEGRLSPVQYDAPARRGMTGDFGLYRIRERRAELWLERDDVDPVRMSAMHEEGLFGLVGRDFVRVRVTPTALDLLMLGAPEPRHYPRR